MLVGELRRGGADLGAGEELTQQHRVPELYQSHAEGASGQDRTSGGD